MKQLVILLMALISVGSVKAGGIVNSDNGGGMPPAVDLDYYYIDLDSVPHSGDPSKYNGVRLRFSETEGIDRIVIERLRDGFRVPSKIDMTDLSKGYYNTAIDRNTTFTAVAYNENGYTRGKPVYVEFKATTGIVETIARPVSINRIVVYNINGKIVYDGNPAIFYTEQLFPGVYIKQKFLSDGTVKTDKLVVR